MLQIEHDARMPAGVVAVDDDAGVAVVATDVSGERLVEYLLAAGYCPGFTGEWDRCQPDLCSTILGPVHQRICA